MQRELFSELDTDPDFAAGGGSFHSFHLVQGSHLGSKVANAECDLDIAVGRARPTSLLPDGCGEGRDRRLR